MIKIRKKLIVILAIILALILLIVGYNIYVKNKYVSRDFNNLDLSGVDSIMIVAHPDDEVIWGGSHLLEGNYLVVCITAGNNQIRAEEFLKAIKATGSKGIMLGYPDKTFNKRNDWKKVDTDIEKDVETLLSLKKWKVIATHNPEGEYGHIHHIMTSRIVTDVYKEKYQSLDNLYYFGNYYNKSKIGAVEKNLIPISDDNYQKKVDIIKNIYKSQYFIMDKFGQMVKYENWTKY